MSSQWQENYKSKLVSASEAIARGVKSGNYLVLGHSVATPDRLMQALYNQRGEYSDLKTFQMLYFTDPYHLRPEMRPHLKAYCNFLDKNSRPAYQQGEAEFLPCHFHEVPELFRSGLYPVDVALVHLSRPNSEGYCSFGLSCDYTKPAAEVAPIVIAEVNAQMPFIGGDNLIHVSELDYIVEVDYPVLAIPPAPIGDDELTIGRHCATLIKDGATLQLGIGAIPDAVLRALGNHKDLGIHTEMFTDGVMHMMRSGHINGSRKTLHPGKVVSSIIMGSEELYDFVNNNPAIEMYPVSYTNNPDVVGQNENMVSINSCLEMDLTGQAASEAIGMRQFSGTGGQVDFLRGAKRSKGGISILAFLSTAQQGTCSRIVPCLASGANITAGRNEVDYVVTEYGAVRLRGKSLRERAEALISIAHPKFRPELEEAYKARFGKKS